MVDTKEGSVWEVTNSQKVLDHANILKGYNEAGCRKSFTMLWSCTGIFPTADREANHFEQTRWEHKPFERPEGGRNVSRKCRLACAFTEKQCEKSLLAPKRSIRVVIREIPVHYHNLVKQSRHPTSVYHLQRFAVARQDLGMSDYRYTATTLFGIQPIKFLIGMRIVQYRNH